ncbi:MAG: hypothetical protein HYZ83_05830 [Candidatus Omnitrophica bacterium]|nr:hypothetical protein [Candidatus Omnitrophota bacterium]
MIAKQNYFQKINDLIQKYAQTGDRSELEKIPLEDLKLAKFINHSYSSFDWYKFYGELIRMREERIKEDLKIKAEAHKHYRQVGIGYTATIITLSLLQLKYFHDIFASGSLYFDMFGIDITDGIKLLLMFPLIFLPLFSVLSQFLIFNGYLAEARGLPNFNENFFGPADEIINATQVLFLIGTCISLFFIFNWWAILPNGIMFWFFKRYYWPIFKAQIKKWIEAFEKTT